MTVPSEGVSEAASIKAIVEMSMATSIPALFARLPAESTLDGSEEMSAVETSVSSEVEQLEWPEGTDTIMAWVVKPMPIATKGCMRDLMHWLTYPEAGFWGLALGKALEGN